MLHLDRIEDADGEVKAFLRLTQTLAGEQARAADAKLAAGNAGPLTGHPDGRQGRAVCAGASRRRRDRRSCKASSRPTRARRLQRLFDAGAVMLGVTNCDEFAMGSSTENSGYFPTHNPWDLDRVPGGSSGGSAAAVAAGEADVRAGHDTGGSIRQPAALCGVVGMKPTYGRVSRYGLIAFASSLDQIGPFTRSVEDCALVLEAMAGHDPLDATCADRPNDVLRDLARRRRGDAARRAARVLRGRGHGARREGSRSTNALQALEAAGAELVDVSLPHTDYGLAAYYIIAPAECSSNLARFDGVQVRDVRAGRAEHHRGLHRTPAARASAPRCGAA